MAGGTSGFNMIQSFKDNRSIKSGRSPMKDNPYQQGKSNRSDSVDPEIYASLIADRDRRKSFQKKLSLGIFLGMALIALILFLFIG
ncbi:MAG: hypothetical protein ACXIUD_18050 [Mongoliitalea sp.]